MNSGEPLTIASLVAEIKIGVGITVADVEEEEGELGVMDLTPVHDGQSIPGGLVVQGMKVLLEVHHGEPTSFYSTFAFFA